MANRKLLLPSFYGESTMATIFYNTWKEAHSIMFMKDCGCYIETPDDVEKFSWSESYKSMAKLDYHWVMTLSRLLNAMMFDLGVLTDATKDWLELPGPVHTLKAASRELPKYEGNLPSIVTKEILKLFALYPDVANHMIWVVSPEARERFLTSDKQRLSRLIKTVDNSITEALKRAVELRNQTNLEIHLNSYFDTEYFKTDTKAFKIESVSDSLLDSIFYSLYIQNSEAAEMVSEEDTAWLLKELSSYREQDTEEYERLLKIAIISSRSSALHGIRRHLNEYGVLKLAVDNLEEVSVDTKLMAEFFQYLHPKKFSDFLKKEVNLYGSLHNLLGRSAKDLTQFDKDILNKAIAIVRGINPLSEQASSLLSEYLPKDAVDNSEVIVDAEVTVDNKDSNSSAKATELSSKRKGGVARAKARKKTESAENLSSNAESINSGVEDDSKVEFHLPDVVNTNKMEESCLNSPAPISSVNSQLKLFKQCLLNDFNDRVKLFDQETTEYMRMWEHTLRGFELLYTADEKQLDKEVFLIDNKGTLKGIRGLVVRYSKSDATSEDILEAFIPHKTTGRTKSYFLEKLDKAGYDGTPRYVLTDKKPSFRGVSGISKELSNNKAMRHLMIHVLIGMIMENREILTVGYQVMWEALQIPSVLNKRVTDSGSVKIAIADTTEDNYSRKVVEVNCLKESEEFNSLLYEMAVRGETPVDEYIIWGYSDKELYESIASVMDK